MEEMGVAITTTKEDVSSPFPCGTGFNSLGAVPNGSA
jgi:hypothetical protein